MDFDKIYLTHYPSIFKYLLQLTRCEETSKDLVQEVFESLYIQKQKKQNIKDVRAWLFKTAYNRFVNNYNKQKYNLAYIQETIRTETQYEREPEIEANEKVKQLEAGLNKLEPKAYHLLILYQQGLKYKEMAEILEINPASVGKTLSRTIEKLRTIIKEECHELFEK